MRRENQFAPTNWRGPRRQVQVEPVSVKLPSGGRALVRHVTLADLHREHVFIALPMALQEHHVDRVLAAVLINPKVEVAPSTPMKRKPGALYTDDIPEEDRRAIIDACGVRDGG